MTIIHSVIVRVSVKDVVAHRDEAIAGECAASEGTAFQQLSNQSLAAVIALKRAVVTLANTGAKRRLAARDVLVTRTESASPRVIIQDDNALSQQLHLSVAHTRCTAWALASFAEPGHG